jgi:hypothetical protein
MMTGIQRFGENPWGSGLASAGPAYRYSLSLEEKSREDIEALDRYYIPESWYIQQMVEGGIPGFALFMSIIFLLLHALWRTHIALLGMFVGILGMNMFLHTFEAAYLSMLLFALLGVILGKRYYVDEINE